HVLRGGLAPAARGGRRHPLFLGRRQLRHGLVLVVLAGRRDRFLELTDPLAERTAHLGQPLGTEDQKQQEEQNRKLPPTQRTGHESRIAGVSDLAVADRRWATMESRIRARKRFTPTLRDAQSWPCWN